MREKRTLELPLSNPTHVALRGPFRAPAFSYRSEVPTLSWVLLAALVQSSHGGWLLMRLQLRGSRRLERVSGSRKLLSARTDENALNPVFPAGDSSPLLRSRVREALWPNFRADTARFRSSPSFLILGADQAGTTTLWRYLGKHGQVLPSTRRDVGYFGDSHYQGANWYRSHFPMKSTLAAKSRMLDAPCVTAECSNHYLWTAASAPRIQQALPEAKLLVMLRDPVARAVAHHRYNTSVGIERRNFERCISIDLELIERLGGESLDGGQFGYVRNGLYGSQLRSWLAHVDRPFMHIVESESFFEDPAAEYHRILEFLGLDPLLQNRMPSYRPFREPTELAPAMRSQLEEVFAADLVGLSDRLGTTFRWDHSAAEAA